MTRPEPWHAVATDLVDVAAGRATADLVIRGGRWVNVLTREVVPGMDIAVRRGRIACIVEDAGYCIGDGTRVVEAEGRFMVPGLTDGHLHVESSMCTITEYVRAVLPHGTTAIFTDPHEVANVFGVDGVRMMVAEAEAAPIHVFVQMPSCVPSAPGLETPGARITPDDVQEAMRDLAKIKWSNGVADNLLSDSEPRPHRSGQDQVRLPRSMVRRAPSATLGGGRGAPDGPRRHRLCGRRHRSVAHHHSHRAEGT